MRTVHFIAGLPRSGSTLLVAMLKQNPRFHAEITGPMASLLDAVHHRIGATGEFATLFDTDRCARMLRGLFDIYYDQVSRDSIVFDTNRSWTSKLPLLAALFPRCRIICCVREIGWIIDSLERLRANNPLKLSKIFTPRHPDSIYTRTDDLMNSETGLIGAAWSTLRESWFSQQARRLIVVPYENLARQPEQTLTRLYRELGETPYNHNFSDLAYQAPEYDQSLGIPGLHTVRGAVELRERPAAIPPDLFAKYAHSQFWLSPELNTHGAVVL